MEEQQIPQQRVTTVGPTTSILDDVIDVPSSHPHISSIPILPQLSAALGLLFLIFGITFIDAQTVRKPVSDDMRIETIPTPPTTTTDTLAQAYADVRLRGRAAIVWDVQNQKVLFNKNADDQLPLASITKLMTALVAYELLDPSDRVTISAKALKTDGDSGFVDGETFTMQNLADITLIESSNDGAAVLSDEAGKVISKDANPDKVFVTAMNLKAQELGLTNTYFKNSTGLDVSANTAGAYGSARDVALLMEHIITHETNAVALTNLDITTIHDNEGKYHVAKNTNESVNKIDGLIASKTGYTALAGGNLVVAFNAGLNRPIIVAVLGSSQQGRFDDTLSLIAHTKTYIDSEVE